MRARFGMDAVPLQLREGDVHTEDERGDQAKVHRGHRPTLRGGDFVEALFFFGPFAEEGEDAWQGNDQDEPDDEVGMRPGHPAEHDQSDQPKPGRKRGGDAAAIEHADGV